MIKEYKLFRNKETGALYGIHEDKGTRLIPDVDKAWKRLKAPRKDATTNSIDNLIIVEYEDCVYVYVKE